MYLAKDFSHLLGMDGLSDTLFKNHFILYEGYVNNINKMIETLKTKESGTQEYSELRRRFGWEWNGMRLHELYFENISKHNVPLSNRVLKQKIENSFLSYENWEKEFRSISSVRGIGWVVLLYDKKDNRLFNAWIGEHDEGVLVGTIPLLVMDVFEHSYMTDYGIKKAEYISMFMNHIDWHIVEERL